MIKLAVNGSLGRMGERILFLAKQTPGVFKITGGFDREAPSLKLSAESLKGSDVLIDFSSPEGTSAALKAALKTNTRLVIGTTGIDANGVKEIQAASKKIAILFSPNMSLGVNLTAQVLEMMASRLGTEFKISMTETHHIHKKDAPSGTALMLKKAMAVSGQEIEIKSIREGEVVGDHTVVFSGPAETIEVTHRAHSRDVFARGALKAAAFLAAKGKPGKTYSIQDVLRG